MRKGFAPFAFVTTLCLGGWVGFETWVKSTNPPDLHIPHSVQVFDRQGEVLRAYTMGDGRWRLPVQISEVDPKFIEMLIAYEDKRFQEHAGVDLIALLRSAVLALRHRQVHSGGSTLTMQVARLLEGGATGQWGGKLRQIRLALALERDLSKDQILTLYLNLAPYGGNIEGVRAASLAYFARPPKRLSNAQAALLVALPQSPERRRPDRYPDVAIGARDRVLQRLGLPVGIAKPIAQIRHPLPRLAPHLADRILQQTLHATQHESTLDANLQSGLEQLAKQVIDRRSDGLQVAMIAANWRDGHILASVGSGAYGAETKGGFIDLTQSTRSPGSTLKPLVYGLGFDAGLIHPETMIADRPIDFSGYRPQNFDGVFRGEVRVREALHASLNIPVVSVTEAVGPLHLLNGLRKSGVDPQLPGGTPGLAIALGGVGITLEEMVQHYAGLANQGQAVDLRWHVHPTAGFVPRQIISPIAAWYLADILRGTPRPRGIRASGIAFKTGTSYGHRDAWSIGFDGKYVVGIWMGRADGTPVPGVFGGDLAAPVMFDVFARLSPNITPIAPPPRAALRVSTAELPVHLQRFGDDGLGVATGPEIAFPPDGAVLENTDLVVKVTEGQGPYLWLANGVPVLKSQKPQVMLNTLQQGFTSLTVVDGKGRSAQSNFEIRLP